MVNTTHYDRASLLALRNSKVTCSDFVSRIPHEIRTTCFHQLCCRRKRGKRGGLQRRLRRRKYKIPLPTIMLSNVQSLGNKLDELRHLALKDRNYRDCCVTCLTETWLCPNVPDSAIELPGFRCMRSDRTKNSGKSKGGGICIYVNNRWCTDVVVKQSLCTPNLELLAVQCRPFYLPREFGCIIFICVYIPPSANTTTAADEIHDIVYTTADRKPNSAVIILGDFNSCKLEKVLPTFEQYVLAPTRENKTLDLVYSNISNAYVTRTRAPLGKSDHATVHVLPKYKQKLKSTRPTVKTKKVTDMENLRDCLAATDWNVFLTACNDLNELTDTVSGYINFCTELWSKTKTTKTYPNTKPWITREVAIKLKEKHLLLQNKSTKDEIKKKQKEVDASIATAKQEYKKKIESHFIQGNIRETWKGLNNITNKQEKKNISHDNAASLVNDLNTFYCRFHEEDPTLPQIVGKPKESQHIPIAVTEDAVRKELKALNSKKAQGPDNISPAVLKECANELAGIFCPIFNMSLEQCSIPSLWKTSNIIPVPKKNVPRELNDYRPIALTPVIMKTLEKIVKRHLLQEIDTQIDPMQFAYRKNRCTEDAVLSLLHTILEHLEQKESYVRTLFIDFSSAFNTIKPSLLHEKLLQFGINPYTRQWLLDFLLNRRQFVTIGVARSKSLTISTGAPQGCVLSPTCFSIYTSDSIPCHNSVHLYKYADDEANMGLITNNNETEYRQSIDHLAIWCKKHNLQLNAKKTKELIFDFRKKTKPHIPVRINNEAVEIVKSFTYLGVHISDSLNWAEHINSTVKKCNQRMHCLRLLKKFKIDRRILYTFHQAAIQSVMTYASCAWGPGATKADLKKLNRIQKRAARMIQEDTTPVENLITSQVMAKASKIQGDKTHPLTQKFEILPSGRRLRAFKTKTTRMKNSFVPLAITILNRGDGQDQKKREKK